MAFDETRASGSRRILEGVCPVNITLAEAVQCGDLLGITSATWVRSAHTSAEQPLLVAAYDAPSGAIIPAYPMACVECTNTATNKTTVGEQVAICDAGEYQVQASNLPDVGYSLASEEVNTKTRMIIFPLAAQITTVRA